MVAKNGITTLLIPVSDLAAAKSVYTVLLGCEPMADAPYYVGYESGGQHIGLVPDDGSQGPQAPVAYWAVDDLDAAIAELTAAGATVAQAPREVGGGRTVATLADPDGNLIGLAHDA